MAQSKRVFVGDLPFDVSRGEIEDQFGRAGKIDTIDIKRGFAFVSYVEDRDAENAVREHHGQVFPGATNGRRMRVEISRPRERREYDDRDRDGGRDGGRPRFEERGGDRGFERRDDRGYGGDRDRDRGYERRDDRFGGDRDRGFGRDRFGGDRERRDFGRRDDRGPRTQQRSEHRLLLLDLPDRTSWQDLKDFVRQSARSGRVLFTEVRADPAKAGFKIGIAEFGSREDLEDAVANLNGKNVHGEPVRVEEEGKPNSYDALTGGPSAPQNGAGRRRSSSRDRGNGGRGGGARDTRDGDRYRERERERSPSPRREREPDRRFEEDERERDREAPREEAAAAPDADYRS